MLIMMYAHARFSGDGTLLMKHVCASPFAGQMSLSISLQYDTAKRWADYLVANTLTPSNQCVPSHIALQFKAQHGTPRDTADGENSANLTNLAIKGIIGVKAMAEIGDAVQQGSDAQYYKVCHSSPSEYSLQQQSESCRLKRII